MCVPHRLAVGTEQCSADRYLIARLACPACQEQGTENNHGYPHSRVRHRDLNLVADGTGKVQAVAELGVRSRSEALFHCELELFISTGHLSIQLQLLRLVLLQIQFALTGGQQQFQQSKDCLVNGLRP